MQKRRGTTVLPQRQRHRHVGRERPLGCGPSFLPGRGGGSLTPLFHTDGGQRQVRASEERSPEATVSARFNALRISELRDGLSQLERQGRVPSDPQ